MTIGRLGKSREKATYLKLQLLRTVAKKKMATSGAQRVGQGTGIVIGN